MAQCALALTQRVSLVRGHWALHVLSTGEKKQLGAVSRCQRALPFQHNQGALKTDTIDVSSNPFVHIGRSTDTPTTHKLRWNQSGVFLIGDPQKGVGSFWLAL